MQPPTPSSPPPAPRRRGGFRRFVITLLLLGAAFGAGYIPPMLEGRRMAAELQTTRLDLRLANLHRQLGVASLEAQRNNFGTAMTAARAFFDGCRELSATETFEHEPRTRTAIATYASQSDTVLTELATANPQAKQRLLGLYLAMDGVLQRRL